MQYRLKWCPQSSTATCGPAAPVWEREQGKTRAETDHMDSFFAQFDLMGLAFVDQPEKPLDEVLQIEGKSAQGVLPHP